MSESFEIEVTWIADWLAGACSPEEAQRIERWISDDGERAALVSRLHAARATMAVDDRARDIELREALLRRIEQAGELRNGSRELESPQRERVRVTPIGTGVQRNAPVTQQWMWRGVTAVAIAAAVGIIFTGEWHGAGEAKSSRVYATKSGEQASVTLSDGTLVILASNTTMREEFGPRSRTVTLAPGGEASFTVAQSAGVPFLVRGGNVTARVLGTSFLARRTVQGLHVSVADGKVRLDNQATARNDSGKILAAGDVGTATDSTVQSVHVGDELAPGAQWKQGQLVFHDTPVAVVLNALTRWYGYQFRCADSTLPPRNVTIALNMRSSMAALSTLERILSVNVNVVGDTVTLIPQHTRRTKSIPRAGGYDVWAPTREVGR